MQNVRKILTAFLQAACESVIITIVYACIFVQKVPIVVLLASAVRT